MQDAKQDLNHTSADAAGVAALSICESLLLALHELRVVSEKDVRGILEDAAATHRGAADSGRDALVHRAAVTLIERMLAARNVGALLAAKVADAGLDDVD